MPPDNDDGGERPSPLLASDRVVIDGRARSYGLGVGGSSSRERGGEASSSSFPIKKIAFKVPLSGGKAEPGAAMDGANAATDSVSSAQMRAEKQRREELEREKREARAAGLRAAELARQGIIPGLIYEDEGVTKYICEVGSFGKPAKGAKRRKSKKKNGEKADGKADDSQYFSARDGEEKVEIGEEDEDEEDSVPLTLETRTATTAMDNATTASEGTKSSRSTLQRLLGKDRKKINLEMTPQDEALQEAKDLLAQGAWMCGVCGTPFVSSKDASSHEKACLIEWAKHDKLVRQGWRDRPMQRDASDSKVPILFRETHQRLNYPEYLPPRTGGEIPLSSPLVKKYLLMTDEALANVARRQRHIFRQVIDKDLCDLSLKKQKVRENSTPEALEEYTNHEKRMHEDLFIWEREYDALKELELASQDRHYYAMLEQRALERRHGHQPHLTRHDYYYHRLNRIRRAGGCEDFTIASNPDANEAEEEAEKFQLASNVWGTIKGRFDHAYKLVKEGPVSADGTGNRQRSQSDDKDTRKKDMKHDENTLYINVVVKNSVQMVNNELQRIARGWWQTELHNSGGSQSGKEEVLDFQFEWIRAHTQKRVISLAGMALASDFTPKKVAVQLSKDLHRLIEPQLHSRGVTIQADIEYREGQYFVLAVNIMDIEWPQLMAWVAKQYALRPELRLGQSLRKDADTNPKAKKKKRKTVAQRVNAALADVRSRFPSTNEMVGLFLLVMHRIHELGLGVAEPILRLCYYLFLEYSINKFILNASTDDIFQYVEKKGMEMQLAIRKNTDQASFMLAALREIRSGGKHGQIDEEDEDEDAKPIIGPLMGPAIKDDNGDAKTPADFSPPDMLEFIGLETDLSVGFLRLRWAMLHASSSFMKDAFFVDVMGYDKVEMGGWSENENDVGLPKAPDGVDESSFVGNTLEYQYLMPKSAFVKANTCYATLEIVHYDRYCLVLKEKTLTPEVPYGNTFVAWTMYSIVNTGKNTCRLICSVEAEFPNGQPMVARQIKSGMRSGTAEKFVKLGETICRYAEAFP